jgi:hypothetical protein
MVSREAAGPSDESSEIFCMRQSQCSLIYTDNLCVPAAADMKSSIPWDITTCSPLKVKRRFGGTCLHLQGLKTNQARHQHEAGSKKTHELPRSSLRFSIQARIFRNRITSMCTKKSINKILNLRCQTSASTLI